jgi:hypothetical protein
MLDVGCFAGYPENSPKMSLIIYTICFHAKWWPEGLGDSWAGERLKIEAT